MATKTKKRPAAAPSKNRVHAMPNVIVDLDVYGNEIQGMEDAPVTVELVINNELPKTFDEAVHKTRDLISAGKTLVLLHAWEIGRITQAMDEDTKNREGRYGVGSVAKMADSLEIGARILFEMMRFHRTYPKIEDVKTLGLEWSSVREIMRLPKDVDRTRVANKAQKEGFTVREVRTEVNDIKAKEAPKKPKTPRKPPKAVAYFEKLDASILTALQNIRIVLEKKADMLKIAGDEELTSEEDFTRLKTIFKRCKQSTERLSAFMAREVVPLEKVFDATPKTAQPGKAKKSKK
jgi:hypothetical protein